LHLNKNIEITLQGDFTQQEYRYLKMFISTIRTDYFRTNDEEKEFKEFHAICSTKMKNRDMLYREGFIYMINNYATNAPEVIGSDKPIETDAEIWGLICKGEKIEFKKFE